MHVPQVSNLCWFSFQKQTNSYLHYNYYVFLEETIEDSIIGSENCPILIENGRECAIFGAGTQADPIMIDDDEEFNSEQESYDYGEKEEVIIEDEGTQ